MTQKLTLVALITLFTFAPLTQAKFRMPAEVPVDRLITNVTAYVKEHPKEAQGYYTLGRLNYLALSLKSKTVRAYENGKDLPGVPDFFQQGGKDAPTEAELKSYLAAAGENFQKAIQLDDKNGLYHLGMASLMDAAVNSGLELGAVPGPDGQKAPTGKDAWRAAAIDEYARAYELAIDKDAQIKDRPLHGLNQLVSYEAATRYAQIIKPDPTPAQTEKLAAMQKRLKPLEQLTGPITPIIFSLSAANRLEELLDKTKTVTFNLDGTGRPQSWPWLKSTTSILVWDPKSSGQITSGKQLFGSVSWWIFWPDGYHALDALDNNRDGQLTGEELKGLAIWTDKNSNGISDPGEVISLESAGITALETHATTIEGQSPTNAIGLRTKEGRLLPTWDWVVHPAATK
jgi:hypothetical protein